MGVIDEASAPLRLALCTLGRMPGPCMFIVVEFILVEPTVTWSMNCSALSLMWPKLDKPCAPAMGPVKSPFSVWHSFSFVLALT